MKSKEDREKQLDRQEALWHLMFNIIKATRSDTLEGLIFWGRNDLNNVQPILYQKDKDILKDYYGDDTKRLRNDLDYLLTSMGECYFDA